MADRRKKVQGNVDGNIFVDTSCIDCDTCRQLAPETFADDRDMSFVSAQPASKTEYRAAMRALLSCPTGSIGTEQTNNASEVKDDFPIPIDGNVYYCGFTSPLSFGGSSYFVRHPEGNWLIDSPKYVSHLVRQFSAMGGISRIFLTHRDDVANAEKYAARFGSERIIHRDELSAQPDAEIVLDGDEATELSPGFIAVPTRGHTRGHCVLLYRNTYLFTGDHLWWSRERRCLNASEDVCWYSWSDQIASMEKLIDLSFEWVLPGHGQRVQMPPAEIRAQLRTLVSRMQTRSREFAW